MKRLLLLSYLIFGLALSACGGGNITGDDVNGGGTGKDDTNKATLDQDCTETKMCGEGLACVLTSGQTDKGKCETACKNGACSGANQECETGVASLDGKTVDVCRQMTKPPKGEPAQFGQVCNANKVCDTNLVCVADAGKTDTGTCQTACPTDTCTDGSLTCQSVSGLNNNTVKACLTPTDIREGEECKETDTCEAGTHCLAKYGRTDVGICTRKTACQNDTECNVKGEFCVKEHGLKGKTLKLCGLKKCNHVVKDCGDANKYVCVNDGINRTEGRCTLGCDPNTNPSMCGAEEKCVLIPPGYNSDGSKQAKLTHFCISQTEADKSPLNGECSVDSDCRGVGLVCAKLDNGNSKCLAKCENIGFGGECDSGFSQNDYCFEWGNEVKACGPPQSSHETKYFTQKEGDECGGAKFCKTDLYCVLTNSGDEEGECTKIDTCPQGDPLFCTSGSCQKFIDGELIYGSYKAVYTCQ